MKHCQLICNYDFRIKRKDCWKKLNKAPGGRRRNKNPCHSNHHPAQKLKGMKIWHNELYFVSDVVAPVSKIAPWWCWVQHKTPSSDLCYSQPLKDTWRAEELVVSMRWITQKLLKTTVPPHLCGGTHTVLPRTIVHTARKGKLVSTLKKSGWSKLNISAQVFKREGTDRRYAENNRVRDLVKDKKNTFPMISHFVASS